SPREPDPLLVPELVGLGHELIELGQRLLVIDGLQRHGPFPSRVFGHCTHGSTLAHVFSRFRNLVSGLSKSREQVFGEVDRLFERRVIDDELWEELTELLIYGDVGLETSEELVGRVRERVRSEGIKEPAQAREILQQEMVRL